MRHLLAVVIQANRNDVKDTLALAPKGQTPILTVRGRHLQKVSVMAALSLSPRRGRLGLHFRTRQDGCFQTEHVVAFLRDLHDNFRGCIIVVWDGWKVHQAAAKLVQSKRLETVTLPGYAPELNPVEHVWNRLKWGDLANAAPVDSDELYRQVRPLLQQTPTRPPGFPASGKAHDCPSRKRSCGDDDQ